MKGTYPESPCKRFRVKDAIGVPHPYMIGTKHVVHAADHFGGMLSEACIEDGESKGIFHCDICKGKLSFKEHEQALAVQCDADDKPALSAYLKSLVEEATKNGYAGFVFVKNWK